MKYLIRAVKYFFYFAILFSLITTALVLIGAVEGDINAIFEEGYGSLWKIAIFFVIVAAVYPKVGFITTEAETKGSMSDISDEIIEFMKDRQYSLESRNEEMLTFRYNSPAGRLTRMNEDRVTMTPAAQGIRLEGLRKDVIRLATGLEHRFLDKEA